LIKPLFEELLGQANRLLSQNKDMSNKLYSLHAPEVSCIAKGKTNKRYEFGCKVSLVLTHSRGLALSVQALHDNPYDGHTLKTVLNHAQSISGTPIAQAFVDIADPLVLIMRCCVAYLLFIGCGPEPILNTSDSAIKVIKTWGNGGRGVDVGTKRAQPIAV
jgi:hypothetical protein